MNASRGLEPSLRLPRARRIVAPEIATFLTIAPEERQAVEAGAPFLDLFARPEFQALDPDAVGENGTVAVYRFFNLATGGHFFTISEQERAAVEQDPLIRFEGVGFAAFADEGDAAGLVPIFRLFDRSTGTHLFLSDADERAELLERGDVRDEGVAFFAFPDEADPTFVPVNVFRFQNETNGATFLTLSPDERDDVIAGLPGLRLNADPEFEALSADAAAADGEGGAEEIYRFFNTVTGGHFFTISEAERDQIIAENPLIRFEGIGFSAFANADDAEGLTPVFRLFNLDTGTHVFITDPVERDALLADPRVSDEGIGFYAFADESAEDRNAESVAADPEADGLLI